MSACLLIVEYVAVKNSNCAEFTKLSLLYQVQWSKACTAMDGGVEPTGTYLRRLYVTAVDAAISRVHMFFINAQRCLADRCVTPKGVTYSPDIAVRSVIKVLVRFLKTIKNPSRGWGFCATHSLKDC